MTKQMLISISSRCSAVAFALLTLYSCKKNSSDAQPTITANFTYSGAGQAPANVFFANTSTGATTYVWDFGDGTATSTQNNPNHTYNQGGVYTVKLTAQNGSQSNSTTKTVNITAPTSVKITGFKVTAMPFTDPATGAGWDNNSGPDVYYVITDASNAALYNSPTYFQNATVVNLPISWTLTPAFQIPSLTASYKFVLYDMDTNDVPPNPDDFIGGYSFTFGALAAAGYPTTVTLQGGSTGIKIDLTLQWQ